MFKKDGTNEINRFCFFVGIYYFNKIVTQIYQKHKCYNDVAI